MTPCSIIASRTDSLSFAAMESSPDYVLPKSNIGRVV
jgi:hypothetical protein